MSMSSRSRSPLTISTLFTAPIPNFSSSSSSPSTMGRNSQATPLTHSLSDSGLVFPSPSTSTLAKGKFPAISMSQFINQFGTMQEREDFMFQLLASMPRSQLSSLQQRIAPLLQFDVVSSLPTEVALQIFSHIPAHTLLICSLVSKRWNVLANDQSLWKALCHAQGWEWRHPISPNFDTLDAANNGASHNRGELCGSRVQVEDLDEGMGDSDDDDTAVSGGGSNNQLLHTSGHGHEDSMMLEESDSGSSNSIWAGAVRYIHPQYQRHQAPPPPPSSSTSSATQQPNFKLLYRTHTHLRNRFLTSSYRLSVFQTRGSPSNGHANMIYCVQLYTYPETNQQVMFTGSRDKTIREWDLRTGEVERVFQGVHTESVLSLCVRNGWMVSAGSDWRVVLWDLDRRHHHSGSGNVKGKNSVNGGTSGAAMKVLRDHADSVLCVRFDDERLASCSKDQTIRLYSFPNLELLHVLSGHRAAVNAISLSKDFIVSGSGDRSMNVWDIQTGKLIRTFEDHHTRGIASIDFKQPYIVSGSSDKHIRLIDVNTSEGWSTSPEYDGVPLGLGTSLPLPGLLTPLGPSHAPFLPRHLYRQQYLYSGTGDSSLSCMCQSCGSGFGGGSNSTSIPASASYSNPSSATSTSTPGIPITPSPLTFSQSLPIPHLPSHYRHSHHIHHAYPILPRRTSSSTSSSSANPSPLYPPIHTSTAAHHHHSDLVRSVTLGPDFVITGSYDLSVKIWDRMTGILVGDLKGGHTGKIFCVAADRTKVVSCGEDLRICVWDFSGGVEGVEAIKSEW